MEESLIDVNLLDLKIASLKSFRPSDEGGTVLVSAGKDTLLHIAANSGDKSFIILELSSWFTSPTDVYNALLRQNARGDTPIHCAASKGVCDLLNVFISRMNNNPQEKMELLRIRNMQGDTALHLAVRNNHFNVVDMLMKEDASLGSMANNSGEYPLYVAARKGFLEITDRLIVSPATGPGGKTALHAAVAQSRRDVVQRLIDTRPDLCRARDESGSTALLYAASSGNMEILRSLLNNDDSTVLLSDEYGLSALHVAATMGRKKVLHEILQRRHDFCQLLDNTGRTFLHAAIVNGRTGIVKFVLKDSRLREILNQQDCEGNTPLHLAVISCNRNMVSLLLADKRVVLDHINQKGQTPLDLASSAVVGSPVEYRMYQIMEDFASFGLKFSTQRADLVWTKQKTQDKDEEEILRCRTVANNLAIVAVLIATVTFAAAFTLPGGYKNDPRTEQGMAALTKAVAFKVFLISDTLAMVSSIIITCLLVRTGSRNHDVRMQSINVSMGLMNYSVGGMIVAFATGVYAVVSADSLWLAILVCIMAAIVPLAVLTINIWPSRYNDAINLWERHVLKRTKRIAKRNRGIESQISELRSRDNILWFRCL